MNLGNNKLKLQTKPKVTKFLEKTKIIEKIKDDSNNILNLENITFEDFKNILIRINGIIRNISKKNRGFDNEVVITNNNGNITYLPPDNKEKYLKKLFDKILEINSNSNISDKNKKIGVLIYYGLQNIHPFEDGNGRTGRFIYSLLKNSFNLEDLKTYNGILDNNIGRSLGEEELTNPEKIRLEYTKKFFKERGINTERGIFPIFNGKTVFVNDENINNIEKYNKVNRIINGNLSDGTFSFKNYIAYKINDYKKIYDVGYNGDKTLLKLDGDIDLIFNNLDDSDFDFIIKEYNEFEEGRINMFLDFDIDEYKKKEKQKEWEKLNFIIKDGLEKYFDKKFILEYLDIDNINLFLYKKYIDELDLKDIQIKFKIFNEIYQDRKEIVEEYFLLKRNSEIDLGGIFKEKDIDIKLLNDEKIMKKIGLDKILEIIDFLENIQKNF